MDRRAADRYRERSRRLVRISMPQGKVGIGFVVDLDETKVRLADAERDEGRPVLKHIRE
jgi:hypothetical protein